MNRIIPTIGASIMLAANVLTNQAQIDFFSSDETKEPGDKVYYDLNADENANVGEEGTVDPLIDVEQVGTGSGRIIIHDNDYMAPKYQKNPAPLID